MGVGVWNPDGDKEAAKSVDQATLEKCLTLAAGIEETISEAQLESAGLESDRWLMALEEDAWRAAEALDKGQLESLARLFTLVESQVFGWDAGKKSPVIPLVKILKSREEFEPELRKWIKANTDNRYLPHGSAL